MRTIDCPHQLTLGILFSLALLLVAATGWAGTISIASVTESSVVAGDSSTYTFTFTPPTSINSSNWSDGAYFWFDFDNDFTVSSATLGSISPSISGMSINGRSDSNGEIRMHTGSGSIVGGTEYTVVLNNVTNPATTQTPDNHEIRTGDGAGIVDSGQVAAAEIVAGATNPPSVSSQIPDKSLLEESEGVVEYVADLNNHFVDLDGDTMTFTSSSSDATAVAVTNSGTNGQTLSIEAKKYGSADITVTATATDGSADDIFTVTTIGTLGVNSVSSSNDTAGQATTLTFGITLEATVSDAGGDGAYIYFDLPADYGVIDGTTTIAVSSLTGSSNVSAATSNVWFIASSSTISPGTYTVTISNVTNPGAAGSYGNAVVDTRDGGGTTFDKGSIALPTVGASSAPTVTNPIPDQTGVEERDGVQQLIADLNNNFTDADGDTLTFTVSSTDSTIVAATTSGTNGRILSIEAKKYGSANITVTATSTDGSVDDTFSVGAIGELVIGSISSSNDIASQSTDLTVNFTLETTVSDAGGDGAYVFFNLPADYGVDGTTTVAITSPAVSGTSFSLSGSSDVYIVADAATISAGSYTAVISNVTNPGSGGSFGNLEMDTRDGGSTTFDIGDAALPTVDPGSVPTVSSPIPDQLDMRELDGAQQVVADLNNHFTDGDGDTLTFSVANVGDGSVVTVSLSGANNRTLTLTPLKAGSTTVTIQAADNVHGTADDTFTVSTIGLLPSASVTPNTLETNALADFAVSLTNEAPIPTLGVISVDFPDTMDVAAASISGISMGGASAGISSRDTVNSIVNITITSGTVSASTSVSFTLTGIQTPGSAGSAGQYYLFTTDGTDTLDERFVAGDTFVATYAVTYNGNGHTSGIAPVDSNSYLAGETVTVLDNTGMLERTDDTFAGWNTSVDGSGTAYAPGDTFIMGSADVTLYALWRAKGSGAVPSYLLLLE